MVKHSPKLHAPWFAPDEGVTLHRYFDDQFVPQFVQEAKSGRLTATRQQAWYNSERFGVTDMPTLRLPMHQTFYIVCCELSCDTLGLPAFDPKRVKSAGFVIRRNGTQRWMLHQGTPLGWQTGTINHAEPDEYRRFVEQKLIQPQSPEPAYSGEETHPLHPLLVKQGTQRSHTLLWGYLPLGGSYRINHNVKTSNNEANNALRTELLWPFGERERQSWQHHDSRPALQGIATQALYELLNVLLTRYHVFDDHNADNGPLRAQLSTLYFYQPLQPQPPKPFDAYATPSQRHESLLEWIEKHRDELLVWLNNINTGNATLNTPLPGRNDDLFIAPQQAQQLRDTLMYRGGMLMMNADQGLAMPKFGQADEDKFYIVPFVRWQDECGCEKIHWGAQHSIDFRVVSPFDPEAQRPRAIILPGLKDLRRGSAKGVTMMVPKSLADVLLKIKPDMDVSEGGPGNSVGLCWNFSFSLPAITICAFMILMIILNLLNLFLFWLPYVFIALPRLCGKLLGGK